MKYQKSHRDIAEVFCPRTLLLAAAFVGAQRAVMANPQTPKVTQGSASITTQGSQLTVQTTGNAFINWSSFNIAPGETTTFIEPTATSVIWNKISDANPSQLLGTLNANGYIILQNQSGFVVGGQAVLNAAGLIMTTSPTVPLDLTGGSAWQFSAPPPTASIINYGQINTARGGSVFLIANNIENNGTINSPGGNVGLYAGKEVLVSERPDGRGLSASVTLPAGSVDNNGKLIADAGTIAMNAQVVNQGGLVQANSVKEVNGVIELVAGDSLNLAATSQISARGDAQGPSSGGTVTFKSGGTFNDTPTSSVDISGGAQGGNGGSLEISAPQISAINSQINAAATSGWTRGQLFLDPVSILLVSDESGTDASSGTVNAGDQSGTDSGGGLTLNVQSLAGFSTILLQASKNITLAGQWNLGDSLVANSSLTLEAGQNILAQDGASITAGKNWTVNLFAGQNFNKPAGTVISGTGTVDLTGSPTAAGTGTGTASIQTDDGALNVVAGKNIFIGNGFLQTDSGALNVTAGQNLTIGGGAIRTLNGGSITAQALTGSVTTGTSTTGYDFGDSTAPGYSVDPALGGISTEAGGNVTINAGLDVVSFLPGTKNSQDAGSGAFGPEPGIVNITAGRNVTGHFVAAESVDANGNLVASTINAGQDAGTAGKLLSLSLVTGGWDVNAPNGSIFLQEVHNPNGTLDNLTGSFKHVFDYDPNSFVNLNAANLVELAGTSLPRNGGDNVPILYPPSLTIEAGSGGVALGNNTTLFPSPDGELSITTTSGGPLQSLNGSTFNLVMSDSGRNQWTTGAFGTSDHAGIPVQLDNPNPVVMNISGNVTDMTFFMPKETELAIGGDMDNSTFNGQNLHPGDTTTIDVAGQLFSRNQSTFEPLGAALPGNIAADLNNPLFFSLLFDASGNQLNFGNGQTTFVYAPGSTSLGYVGRMTSSTLASLEQPLQMPVFVNGQPLQKTVEGQPVFDAGGNPVYVLQPAPFLGSSVLNFLFTHTQDVPATQSGGYHISGPGNFDINAGSIDLGSSSPGIISFGPAGNRALTGLGQGANINIDVAGDLTMFSSTIATYLGGDINIFAGGSINVGSQNNFGGNAVSRGIYTVGPGDVNVTAFGTVDVAGSRIGTFDGGNINVESLTGNVDAGNGAQSSIFLTIFQVDPITGLIDQLNQTFSGSGIIAFTLPLTVSGGGVTIHEPATDQPGNINIETPRGNIIASLGGIVQEPLNGNNTPGPTVNLTAGTRDADGNIIFPGNIDVSQSGVIGGNVSLSAAGSITGLVIGRQNTTVTAVDSFSGTVLSGGTASVSAGGNVAGTVVGLGGVNVGSGGAITANLVSQNVSVGGASVGSTLGTATASASATAAASTLANNDQPDKTDSTLQNDDDLNKKKKLPLLAKMMGRVTVILPPKH